MSAKPKMPVCAFTILHEAQRQTCKCCSWLRFRNKGSKQTLAFVGRIHTFGVVAELVNLLKIKIMTSEIKQKNIELLFDTLKVILTNQNLEDLSIVKKTKSANKSYSYNEVEITYQVEFTKSE